jgi:hypothetical protein
LIEQCDEGEDSKDSSNDTENNKEALFQDAQDG